MKKAMDEVETQLLIEGVTELPGLHGASQPLGTISVSIGISAFAKHIDTADKVIEAADRALYKAKRGGKNRIEFYV